MGDVVRIGLELLSALAAAHDLGVVHGDLHPDSVFLVERDGLVLHTLLSGFGDRARRAWRGSLPFVAPEVAAGVTPTFASDLYAAGAILHLAATGFAPYSPMCSVAPMALRPGMPARLTRVVVEALQTNPANRYGSARAMLQGLELARVGFGGAYVGPRAERESVTTLEMPRPATH